MLKNLVINNIALIDHIELNFEEGLTVLSGETGSGKSIIIDSLAFVLGDRADKTLIKHGESVADVSALFCVEEDCPVLDKMEEYGYGRDTEILLSRKMTLQGKNEIRIQGKTTTLAILKEICAELVDIFGQGQHLALLDEKKQLVVLDSFCNFDGIDCLLRDKLYPQLLAVNKQLKVFGGSDAERERLMDILKFQIDEICSAELSQEEEDNLIAQHKRMVNVEKISNALAQAVALLDGDNGAIGALAQSASGLLQIDGIEPQAGILADRLRSVQIEVDDVFAEVQNLLQQTEFSPLEVDRMEERLEKIKQIKRKYGGTIADTLQFLADAQSKYDELANSAERIDQLNADRLHILQQMYDAACKKSAIRKNKAKQFADDIMRELADLGMKNTQFVVDFAPQPTFEEYCNCALADGFDKVAFLMSANVGEPLKPLAKVISGGEMSRFMLAVKNITALAEKIPTMIFDEIDTGISGNIAQMVAMKLANVSANKEQGYQCVVITHLPQIVAMADVNLYISKRQSDGRTLTEVAQLLSSQERSKEIARLMGSVGEHAIVSAMELLDWSQNYKHVLVK